MKNLMSYNKAVELRNELTTLIHLVDNYEVNNLRSWVIREYVITYSIPKVIKNYISDKNDYTNEKIDRQIIIGVLNEPAADDLHKIAKQMYKKKITRRPISS